MKILIITPACHFKNSGAAQNDIYSSVKLLQELGHRVLFYTIDSDKQDRERLNKVGQRYGIDIKKFLPDLSSLGKWVVSSIKDFAFFDRAAYVFGLLVSDPDFNKYLDEEKPDLIFSFNSYSWPVLRLAKEKGIKSVFRSHNFEPTFFWESLKVGEKVNPLNWLRFMAKWLGERRAVIESGVTGTLLIADIWRYRRWKREKNIFDLTLMFPGQALKEPFVNRNKTPLDIFYLGASYNVIFHLKGAELLIEKIAPEVLNKSNNKFRFHILGSKLPKRLIEKCDGENIIYEGYVPDLDDFLSKMDIGAFPVFTGTTMKGKVFEPICRSFPIVIPTNGLGVYPLEDDKHLLIADTVEDFVNSILKLSDDELRFKLSTGAHNFAEKEFGPQTVKRVLSEMFEAV